MAVEKDNYYEDLKNERYKAMLDSEIQASVARDQAMKYTQNQMNAAGYGTQGMSESSALGVQNNYRNALANAASQYRTDINSINAMERNEALTTDDNNFKSVTSLMSGATNLEQLDKIYDMYKNDSSLSDNSKKQLELLYSMYSSDLQNSNISNAQFDLESESATATNSKGEVITVNVGEHFKNERNTLVNAIRTNNLPNDSYINIKNNSGDNIYVRYVNGRLYYVSAQDYQKAQNAYHIYGTKNIVKDER